MIRALILGAALLATPAAAAEPLQPFAWSHRPLLIFAPDQADPRLARQRGLLDERKDALREREIPLIVVAGDAATLDGAPAPFSAEALRRAYGAPAERFTVILIGKDTGVKLRAADVTEPDEVFALIDAMPMRRREMRERRGASGVE